MSPLAMKKTSLRTIAAGLRLRCFLGQAFTFALCSMASLPSSANQLEVSGPIHLTHVEGIVANTYGKRVAGAEVTLSRDGKVVKTTHTDQSGAFHFDHASGNLTFQVGRTQNAPALAEIVATDELVTLVEHKKLYVIVGPGACKDACSAIYTSKHEFESALKKTSRN
jgi:hypothetical protein